MLVDKERIVNAEYFSAVLRNLVDLSAPEIESGSVKVKEGEKEKVKEDG